MAETTTSADGRWDLRRSGESTRNEAGYINGSWQYELVERSTGRVARRWSGNETASPWDSSSSGVSSIRWDGDELVIVENDGESRVRP